MTLLGPFFPTRLSLPTPHPLPLIRPRSYLLILPRLFGLISGGLFSSLGFKSLRLEGGTTRCALSWVWSSLVAKASVRRSFDWALFVLALWTLGPMEAHWESATFVGPNPLTQLSLGVPRIGPSPWNPRVPVLETTTTTCSQYTLSPFPPSFLSFILFFKKKKKLLF